MRQGAAITGNLTHSSLFCPGLCSVLLADVVPTPLRRFLSSPSTSLAGRSPRWTEQTFLPWMFFCFCGKLKKKRRKNVWVHRCKNDCKEITHWEVYFLSAVKWIESQVFITLRWYCYKMAGLCFHFFRCGSLVKQQACVGGASWSSRVVWQLTGQQWLALCRGGVAEVQWENMTPCTYPKVPAVLDPRQGAGPCPETPAIEVGQNKGKIGRKRRILSVFCRRETDSAVKHGQAVPSEGIQDTCTVLMDRASSRKSNTCSTSHSSRDLSSGKASKPWE